MFTLLGQTLVGILGKGSCIIVPAHKVTKFLVFISSGLLVPEQMYSSAKSFPSSTVSKSWNVPNILPPSNNILLKNNEAHSLVSSFLIVHKEYSSEVHP
jgi:hypothetical protein